MRFLFCFLAFIVLYITSLHNNTYETKSSQMERFQGHTKPYFLDRKAGVRSLEVQGFAEAHSCSFKEEERKGKKACTVQHHFYKCCKVKNRALRLLSLQNLIEPWEVESFLSHEGHPHFYQNQVSASYMERTNQALSSQETYMILPCSSSPPRTADSIRKRKNSDLLPPETTREKRKRMRTKPSKNIEGIENQRINHIAVERTRHIKSLRPSYIQRVISTTKST